MGDPKRLLSSSSTGSLAKAMLRSALHPGPGLAEREAVWAALVHELAGLPGPRAEIHSTPPSQGPLRIPVGSHGAATAVGLIKGGAVIVAAMAIASAVLFSRAPSPAVTPPVTSTASAPVRVVPASSIVLEEDLPKMAPSAWPTATVPDVSPRTDRPNRAPLASPPPRVSASAHLEIPLQGESAVLLSARKALRAGECDAALSQTDDARARWPQGTLAEEREMLSIEALECLGRESEAIERRVAFRLAFPASVYLDR